MIIKILEKKINGYQIVEGQNLLEINFINKTPISIVPNQSYIVGELNGTKEMSIASTTRSIIKEETRTISLGNITKMDVPSAAASIHIGVFDVTGKMLSTQNIGLETSHIDIPTNLPLGLYFVRIFDGFKTQTKRVLLP